MKRVGLPLAIVAALGLLTALQAAGQAAKTEKDGKWETADGHPTYNITSDGTVDWYTFSGFRRYHSECHVCHGPDGEGSSYAPGLMESLRTITYEDFMGLVASGREVQLNDLERRSRTQGEALDDFTVQRRRTSNDGHASQRLVLIFVTDHTTYVSRRACQ